MLAAKPSETCSKTLTAACRYDAGAKDYWMSDSSLTAIEFLVVGNLELKRYEGWKQHKTVHTL